ncbi:MAG: 3-oxoadipyl-CoA thiolase, partial [Bacteroidetes bacterium]|nr:3-oxoadipyl-CoA thiolase [Bacteroidota bacterium]
MNTAYIIDIIRTPIGKYGGSLSMVRPDDLAAHVIRQLVERNSWMDLNLIEDVIFGDANQAGEDNRNVARMASLMAGLPVETGGVTVNRLCASGLQSIMDVSRAVMLGEGSIYIAGGVESMSRAPYVMGKPEYAFSRKVQTFDSTIGWRFTNPKLADQYYPYSMGETAENVAEKWKISRQQHDVLAFNSQSRYQKSHQHGKFQAEIVTVHIPQ